MVKLADNEIEGDERYDVERCKNCGEPLICGEPICENCDSSQIEDNESE